MSSLSHGTPRPFDPAPPREPLPHAPHLSTPEKPSPPSGERRPLPWEKGAITETVVDERTRIAVDSPRVGEEELKSAEQRLAPEGAPPRTGERAWLPWLMTGLALAALAVVVGGLYFADGARAAAVGAVWVVLFYAVSCAVVWGAGLMRAKDETAVIHRIEDGTAGRR